MGWLEGMVPMAAMCCISAFWACRKEGRMEAGSALIVVQAHVLSRGTLHVWPAVSGNAFMSCQCHHVFWCEYKRSCRRQTLMCVPALRGWFIAACCRGEMV